MKNQALKKLVSYSLAASLMLAPAAVFAKNDGSRVKANAHANARASTTVAGCVKAFGHLIAPGWIKLNGETTIDLNCPLPFGIAKKLGRAEHPEKEKHATSTPDTTAPSVFVVMASTGTTTATVTWFTTERSDSQVAYGTTTAYGSLTPASADLVFVHSATLTGLAPATTYHFQVRSKDASGNLGTSADGTFSTKAVPDTTAPIISTIATSGISSTSATVSWATDEPATSKVFYASGTSLDLATASSTATSSLVTNHSLTLDPLSASTTYSFAVQSADASSNTSTSASASFVTSP